MLKLIYFPVRSPKVCNTLRLPPDSRSRSYAVGESAKNVLVSCRLSTLNACCHARWQKLLLFWYSQVMITNIAQTQSSNS